MICAKCSRAMQWPDGAMRCDDMKLVSGTNFTECLGKIDGKCKIYSPEEAKKIFEKAAKQVPVKIKVVSQSLSESELTPSKKKKTVKVKKEVSKDQGRFDL